VVGVWGLLQPVADGIKLLFQEQVFPKKSQIFFFMLAPLLSLFLALFVWAIIPFDGVFGIVDSTYSLLIVQIVSSFGVFSIIFAGWASNSKYAFLSCLRGVAQFISYEVCLGFCLLVVILLSGSLNLNDILFSQQNYGNFLFLGFPIFVIMFVCLLAETNRTPFDLVEAEGELVAGFHVEYSSFSFAYFFLAEYSMIILASVLLVSCFWGAGVSYCVESVFFNFLVFINSCIFSFKVVFFRFIFILIRAGLPRFRFDQLVRICWKRLLPIVFGFFFLLTTFLSISISFPIIWNYLSLILFMFSLLLLIIFRGLLLYNKIKNEHPKVVRPFIKWFEVYRRFFIRFYWTKFKKKYNLSDNFEIAFCRVHGRAEFLSRFPPGISEIINLRYEKMIKNFGPVWGNSCSVCMDVYRLKILYDIHYIILILDEIYYAFIMEFLVNDGGDYLIKQLKKLYKFIKNFLNK
jgi:NADH:ubiquinone oxidoreductase subunit H